MASKLQKKWSKVPTLKDYETEMSNQPFFAKLDSNHHQLATWTLRVIEKAFHDKQIQQLIPENAALPFYYYFWIHTIFTEELLSNGSVSKEIQTARAEARKKVIAAFGGYKYQHYALNRAEDALWQKLEEPQEYINNNNEKQKQSEYATLADYFKEFGYDTKQTVEKAKSELQTSAAYPSLQASEEILQSKEAQKLVPPNASLLFYKFVYFLHGQKKMNPLEFYEIIIGIARALREGNKDEVHSDIDLVMQSIEAMIEQKLEKKNKANVGDYVDYYDYFDDDYYAISNAEDYYLYRYDNHDNMDRFQFYNGDRARRYGGYGQTSHYYNNYGGRNQLYRSSKGDRYLYHRRKLQETQGIEIHGFGDYMDSLPVILLFVFLMAVIGVFSHHIYHKRKDGDKMMVLQARDNEESQV